MIGIIDYGVGNLRSVQKAIEYLGAKTLVTDDERKLNACGRLILPGVGSFGTGMENLNKSRLTRYILQRVKDGPLLGICLGMQLLMTESEEEGKYFGLDLVRGKVLRFSQGKIPQIGWNSVHGMRSPLFEGIPEDTQFYFVHSYYCAPKQENVIGMTDYYGDYASAISCGNAYGVQFHPEKSGEAGLALLRNFMRI